MTAETTEQHGQALESGVSVDGANGDCEPLRIPEVAARHRHAAWRSAAHDQYVALADDLAACPNGADRDHELAARQLQRAAAAFEIGGLRSWWSGTAEIEGFAALHRAERHLVPTDPDRRGAYLADLKLRIDRRFKAADLRGKTASALLKAPDANGGVMPVPNRPAVQGALAILHGGTLALRTTQRARRNATVVTGLLFLLAVLLLTTALQHKWGGFDLAKDLGAKVKKGQDRPPVASAWVVALFGALGGLLSVLPMLKRADRVARATGAWTIQALFKVITGTFVALVAAVLVQRVKLPIVKPQDAAALTAWAFLFGYSQDAVTKVLDDRCPPPQLRPRPPPTAWRSPDRPAQCRHGGARRRARRRCRDRSADGRAGRRHGHTRHTRRFPVSARADRPRRLEVDPWTQPADRSSSLRGRTPDRRCSIGSRAVPKLAHIRGSNADSRFQTRATHRTRGHERRDNDGPNMTLRGGDRLSPRARHRAGQPFREDDQR